METQGGVQNVHHVHIWQLDEKRNALEAHVVIDDQGRMDEIKRELKQILKDRFSIEHSTLEFEHQKCFEMNNQRKETQQC
jgi:cobalt-zinc-cadmium efflux system protein